MAQLHYVKDMLRYYTFCQYSVPYAFIEALCFLIDHCAVKHIIHPNMDQKLR